MWTLLVVLVCVVMTASTVALADESIPFFSDSFDRDEQSLLVDEVGNGWVTNGDKPWARAPKQTDLREGALYIEPADAEGSGVLVIRPWVFQDGAIEFRFMLPGRDDSVGVVLADANLKGVHAGHVMSVTMKTGSVKITDMLSGAFDPEIWKRRKAKETTAEDRDRIANCTKTASAEVSVGVWHTALVMIRGDRVEVMIDGEFVDRFQSPGFANAKTTLRMTFREAGAIDDVKLYGSSGVNAGLGQVDPRTDQGEFQPPVDAGRLTVFQDNFEREESQSKTEELGGGWYTNSDVHADGRKQVDLVEGALQVEMLDGARHPVSVKHELGIRNGEVWLRFLLPEEDDILDVDFADKQCPEVLGHHLFKLMLREGMVEVWDLKRGKKSRRRMKLKEAGELSVEEAADMKAARMKFDAPVVARRWYRLGIRVVDDRVSVSLDGKRVAEARSYGFSHPVKRELRLGVRSRAWIDDVTAYAYENPAERGGG